MSYHFCDLTIGNWRSDTKEFPHILSHWDIQSEDFNKILTKILHKWNENLIEEDDTRSTYIPIFIAVMSLLYTVCGFGYLLYGDKTYSSMYITMAINLLILAITSFFQAPNMKKISEDRRNNMISTFLDMQNSKLEEKGISLLSVDDHFLRIRLDTLKIINLPHEE